VVGPALTFRIRQNEQNLSLADVTGQAGKYCPNLKPRHGPALIHRSVADTVLTYPSPHGPCLPPGIALRGAGESLTCTLPAGLVKSELEAQTGLQILQTGVGQVGTNWRILQSPRDLTLSTRDEDKFDKSTEVDSG
jgi:hypothetical protein